MLYKTGNIWDAPKFTAIVVPTNVGWNRVGDNIMGRGVALQAAMRYPKLATHYGAHCRMNGQALYVERHDDRPIICFPTKPCAIDPALSWRGPSSLSLIDSGTWGLVHGGLGLPGNQEVWLPLVGCGAGELQRAAVVPILERHLTSDRFVLIELGE